MTFVFKVLRNGLLRYILYTCPNLWWRSCSKCYGMDCFGTHFTHAQTCDDVRVQRATEWTASVHTLDMPKPVMTFVFKVLRNGLLRYILYTCPNLWWRSCSKCYGTDCFGTYFTHVQTCDDDAPLALHYKMYGLEATKLLSGNGFVRKQDPAHSFL